MGGPHQGQPVPWTGIGPAGRVAGPAIAGALLLQACAAPQPPPPPEAPWPPEVAPPPAPAPAPAAPLLDRYGRLIVEAMEYPWSALGRVNTGGRGFCTGILIGPALVLATARCLYDGVEGRWWAASELHFVAGYQRDAVLIHSAVAGYEVAPEFAPGAGTSLANVTGNWALLALETPIGGKAGWFALQRLDAATRTRLGRGEGFALQAGYRRDWPHSVTVKLACVDGWAAPPGGRRQACDGAPENPELPVFLFTGGEFRALPSPVLLARAEAGRVASEPFRALRRDGSHWGESRAPNGRGAAAAEPRDTVARLLRHLNLLDGPPDPAELRAAIRRFERAAGLPQSGAPSVALLGHLLAQARRGFVAPAGAQKIARPATGPTPGSRPRAKAGDGTPAGPQPWSGAPERCGSFVRSAAHETSAMGPQSGAAQRGAAVTEANCLPAVAVLGSLSRGGSQNLVISRSRRPSSRGGPTGAAGEEDEDR